ncbi:peroxiredoxin [Methylophaga sp. OBS4]|uniref:peroxiredoxin n=1 Tax=Methylophaga sp. OBS4 TaxID=2991935 RepID=UPI002259764A|nr:peroxiredoxin [Methylophaga sp. OBS4]MCX4186704.1 peroxiredoxin [Methylophaga sp. OBS4]
MTIEVGQTLPAGKLTECNEFDPETGCPMNPQPLDVGEMIKGKKIVIFGVPGAYTPLCSAQHLPGFVEHADEIKAAGADEIWCMAVNDAFVMASWGREQAATGKVHMMADGSAEYARALGLDRDLTAGGMGVRCYRFAMIVDDGVVEYIGVEGSGEFGKSKAETILEELKK